MCKWGTILKLTSSRVLQLLIKTIRSQIKNCLKTLKNILKQVKISPMGVESGVMVRSMRES